MRASARIVFAILAILCGAGAAGAQGINPLPLINQFEGPSFTGQNANSSASGGFGDIVGTWGIALQLCGCGTTAQFPTAASAPPNIQAAANAALINSQGLQPWLCPGCDVPFANAVAAAGGPTAFQTTGLSTDPAFYQALNTGTPLSQLVGSTPLAGGDGTSGLTFGDGSSLVTAPAAQTGVPAQSATPFEWVYDQLINAISGQVDANIITVEAMVSGPISVILAFAIAMLGYRTLFKGMDVGEFLEFAIRAAIVIALVTAGSTFYSDWIEAPVVGLPGFFAAQFSPSGVAATPAQIFDATWNAWVASALAVWHETTGIIQSIYIGFCLGVLTALIVLPSLVTIFTVFLIGTFLTLVMLMIGPLMIIGILFKATHRFLHGYVNVLVTLVIFALVVDIVLSMLTNVMTQLVSTFAPSGSPDTDVPGIGGIAIVLLIMAFSMARLPRLVEAIGGAVAVSMDSVGRYMAGGAAIDAGTLAAKAAL